MMLRIDYNQFRIETSGISAGGDDIALKWSSVFASSSVHKNRSRPDIQNSVPHSGSNTQVFDAWVENMCDSAFYRLSIIVFNPQNLICTRFVVMTLHFHYWLCFCSTASGNISMWTGFVTETRSQFLSFALKKFHTDWGNQVMTKQHHQSMKRRLRQSTRFQSASQH